MIATEAIMAEADLHLKLDRILARQDDQDRAILALEEASRALTGGLSALADGLDVQNELLKRVVQAISAEQADSGFAALLVSIQASLAQVVADGEHIVTVLETLPRAMSDAVLDGVRLAMGDGVSPG